jgi:hypothetical protein
LLPNVYQFPAKTIAAGVKTGGFFVVKTMK